MAADPEAMTLDDLRRRRNVVRAQEEELSYRRRLLQAQIDLVGAVGQGGEDDGDDLASTLARILADEPSGAAGEVRAVAVEGSHDDLTPLPDDLEDLTEGERDELVAQLRADEAALSQRRRELLTELDELQQELVRRYRRDGVDTQQLLQGGD